MIDANVIMAMLIKPGRPIDIFFKEELEILAPELLFKELERNKGIIIHKSELSEEEIERLFGILKEKIAMVPERDFVKYRGSAEKICPDPKDVTYFALALHLRCPIWTNEKKLKQQEKIKIYATHELIKMFSLS